MRALSAGVAGDDFDPILAAPAIYFDTDASGDLSASRRSVCPRDERSRARGGRDRAHPRRQQHSCRRHDGNAAAANSQRAPAPVSARRARFSPVRAPAALDAVVGATGADATLFGEYLIAASAAHRGQVADDRRSVRRLARIARRAHQLSDRRHRHRHRNRVDAAVFTDLIPTSTTYVAGSLELNNATLTDAADHDDAGQFATTPAPEVRVNLGDLTSASGPQTVEFAVTINEERREVNTRKATGYWLQSIARRLRRLSIGCVLLLGSQRSARSATRLHRAEDHGRDRAGIRQRAGHRRRSASCPPTRSRPAMKSSGRSRRGTSATSPRRTSSSRIPCPST